MKNAWEREGIVRAAACALPMGRCAGELDRKIGQRYHLG